MKTTHARDAQGKKVPPPAKQHHHYHPAAAAAPPPPPVAAPPPLPPPLPPPSISTTSEAPPPPPSSGGVVRSPKEPGAGYENREFKKACFAKKQTKTGLFYLLDRAKHAKSKKHKENTKQTQNKARRFLVRLKIQLSYRSTRVSFHTSGREIQIVLSCAFQFQLQLHLCCHYWLASLPLLSLLACQLAVQSTTLYWYGYWYCIS